jgi:putative ABC transport system ATP-binding protein
MDVRLRVEQLQYQHSRPLSFSLAAGECVCLSGSSGAGKSLLLRALADLDPHHGEVFLDAKPRAGMSAPVWRRQVSLLAAESRWWEDYVGAHFNGAGAYWQELGFDAETLNWEIKRLSSGERQRLALLRILALQPAVLLLDEPTANLDSENVTRVENLLDRYRRETGAALLWVSHDPAQIARVADRHAYLVNGELQWDTPILSKNSAQLKS